MRRRERVGHDVFDDGGVEHGLFDAVDGRVEGLVGVEPWGAVAAMPLASEIYLTQRKIENTNPFSSLSPASMRSIASTNLSIASCCCLFTPNLSLYFVIIQ